MTSPRTGGRIIRWIAATVAALALTALPTVGAHPKPRTTTQVIAAVFGQYGPQAVRVARCESGLSVWARNGQYLGLFQMGSFARARYGHSWDAWGQARAAFAYFRASGYGWGPWSCKP